MPTSDDRDLSLRWSGRISLTPRILAVNIFALALLAGGFFYLDTYRARIIDGRIERAEHEIALVAEALDRTPDAGGRAAAVAALARVSGARIRVYQPGGMLSDDSRVLGIRNFQLRDPDKDPWQQDAARFLDAMIDTVVGTARAPLYRERAADRGLDWPDVASAIRKGRPAASAWRAPDRTVVITAAAPLARGGAVLSSVNALEITRTVRVERFRLSMVLLVVTLVSILLSLFLARTIVRPMRRLAVAAVRVRLGRARGVVVPRLPSRRDEIGMLARALSDMSQALTARIDATESFAADVTHEIKNPLASLRSAVDSLATVRDPALQERLIAIIRDDVLRLDRLITDISDASRLDAQLSRTQFEPISLTSLIAHLVDGHRTRGLPHGIRIALESHAGDRAVVMGDGTRLERVFENLIDNAVSFSPEGGTISITIDVIDDMACVAVEDNGPGVPESEREAVFRRFHTVRPGGEAFGTHSGLGLAIARTIVEGHQGMIGVESRMDRQSGARFTVRLPVNRAA
ncbi:stimulus-sensing domain-containing protein [Sphingomonas sp. FW199]|uniref:sensor histidine kinase n=1 Tax=Sphingomonas sp. FW199 TaxID=3400217 RepID=UPI003CF2D26B